MIVGENGIGKSTLLGRLSKQMVMDERVVVEQKTPEYFYDRQLSTLKEFFLTSNLSGFNQSAFERLWNGLGLNLKEDRWLSQLSGGEAQSLKLCLSLCKDTSFYLLDEPSQFLDLQRKTFLKTLLDEYLAMNKSILIIEHNREWIPATWETLKLHMVDHTLRLSL